MKILRLDYPLWQGGNNKDYYFGAKILQHIVPYENIESIEVPVLTDFNKQLNNEYGILGQNTLFQQYHLVKEILEDRQPEEIITLGGDCSVSQQPFEYLSEKYGNYFGILWLDAHPDVCTVETSSCNHDMVLNNLISGEGSALAKMVMHPVNPNHVMIAGLIEEKLGEKDKIVYEKNLNYLTPEDIKNSHQKLITWIKHNHIEHLAIHFDLDVLSPDDFHSIFPGQPYTHQDGAIGRLTLEDIGHIFHDVSHTTHVCALTIAQHIPWDGMRLYHTLKEASLFHK